MKFLPIHKTLKDGRIVLIRAVEIADATKIIEFVHGFVYDSEFVPLVEGEFNPTLPEEELILKNYVDRSNSLFLVAEFEGQIIANINLDGNQRQIMRHTAVFGMGMHLEWQNCGLGTIILQSAIDWARNHSELELLFLQVYAENEAGIALYKKLGFVENGRMPNMFKQNNRYHDEITMHLSLK
ncbi:GNAT family N-acetyltransferase [Fluviicola taffensis]|uniref:GCN5-related N-acetyltransferase n=1 Tax=Fluviicola taffensis (strain DSM 16823 / NCIMB 13979 / RW262) TaxID=755732 RepID=F2ICI6_FLUTR|nr:GNAT family protein [Fluviicola taffensis]AEA45456.1 GCN5-related N-acetyltransferase [Fluviicola taffensis DSM 16823]